MYIFNKSVQGASHLDACKECQDYSLSWHNEHAGIICVSDGHGGDRYIHSAEGAKAACEVTLDALIQLSGNDDMAFTDDSLKQLAACIVARWHDRIGETDATEYGCTLLAYVQTRSWWLAIQIGDGHCVVKDRAGSWQQPVPWDERCFLNMTTSMCDDDAAHEFRFAYGCSDSRICQFLPQAVMLCSDGVTGAFGDGELLYGFYGNLLSSMESDGLDKVRDDLQEVLSYYSRKTTGDDMSVAVIVNDKTDRSEICFQTD